MRTITGKTIAWLTEYSSPENLKGDPDKAVSALAFHQYDMTSAGWARVGEATITVEIPDDNTLIANKVESLRAEIQQTRADAEIKCRGLNEKIEQLLAIEYTPA